MVVWSNDIKTVTCAGYLQNSSKWQPWRSSSSRGALIGSRSRLIVRVHHELASHVLIRGRCDAPLINVILAQSVPIHIKIPDKKIHGLSILTILNSQPFSPIPNLLWNNVKGLLLNCEKQLNLITAVTPKYYIKYLPLSTLSLKTTQSLKYYLTLRT